jgi:hypothetical protein
MSSTKQHQQQQSTINTARIFNRGESVVDLKGYYCCWSTNQIRTRIFPDHRWYIKMFVFPFDNNAVNCAYEDSMFLERQVQSLKRG